MHTDNIVNRFKTKLITGFMLGVKKFNEAHRGTAKLVTVLALALIMTIGMLPTEVSAASTKKKPEAIKNNT